MTLITPWTIELFGTLRARRGADCVERFRRGAHGELLAYLACHPSGVHPREELVERHWPGEPPDVGRRNLRIALSALRHRLEPPGTPHGSVLVADNTTVRFNPDAVRTDVADFERAVRAGRADPAGQTHRLEEATDLYGGELLPGCLADWVAPERERLAQMYLEALGLLARALAERGQVDAAIGQALRLVATEPTHESGHLLLVRLYAGAGRSTDALEQYARLRRVLRSELDVEPSDEARRLARDVRAHPARFADQPARFADPAVAGGRAPGAVQTSAPPTRAPGHTDRARTGSDLPVPTTRFFGREREIDLVTALIGREGHRLVTLTGLGGAGKTRLALESATVLRRAGDAPAWFVSLAGLEDAALIPQAVLAVLGVKPVPAGEPLAQIAGALAQAGAGTGALLVLDNFERLVDAGAALVLGLLERTPGLACLVTSRRQLGVAGERVVEVPPLPVPETADTLELLAARPSVRLFIDRAQARSPEFQVTERTREPVAALVRGLEGIPLALEMAAVWAGVRTPARMAAELKDRYGLLARNTRGVPDRHSTLHKAVSWSHDLLPPGARDFLGALSEFRGGWSSEAAAAVCRVGAGEAEALLAELREHSWVTCAEAGGEMRFGMLETLREFAAGRLDVPERDGLARRHAEYFLGLVRAADPQSPDALDRVERELDNLRAALRWAGGRRPEGAALGIALAEGLRPVWSARGHLREAGTVLTEVLGWPEAAEASEPVGRLWLGLGLVRRNLADYAGSEAAYRSAAAVAEQLDLAALRAEAANGLGNVRWNQARFGEARDFYEAALALPADRIPPVVRGITQENLANCCGKAGDYGRARGHYGEAAGLFMTAGNLGGAARVDHNHAVAAKAHGHFDVALPLFARSLQARWQLKDAVSVAYSLEGVADALMQRNLPAPAVTLLGAVDILRSSLGASRPLELREAFTALLGEAREALGETEFERLWDEGRAMQPQEAGDHVSMPGPALRHALDAIAQARAALADGQSAP